MGLQQLGQQFRAAREKLWGLVGEAMNDIENRFSLVYRDMGWFGITKVSSGIRKDVLETPLLNILSGTANNTRIASITSAGGRLKIQTSSQLDGAAVSYGIDDLIDWTDSSLAMVGIPLNYYVEFDLAEIASNFTIDSPVEARPNRRLTIYVFADPTTFYSVSFEPTKFTDTSSASSPDVAKATVYEFVGRTDGKWWPASIPRTGIDPLS